MKKKITYLQLLFLGLIFILPNVARSQTPVWQDTFSGPTINPNYWTFDLGGSGMGNNELEYYTDRTQNAYIQNGNLVIQANKENFGGNFYTSARLKTDGHFAFKYGVIEARIKLPNLKNGLWPAFWTMGTNIGISGWPQCGELDIMEAGSQAAWSTNTVNQNITAATHWYIANGNIDAMYSLPTNLDTGSFYEGYHNFEMIWDSTHVAMLLDSVQYFTMNTSGIAAFHQPQFIILNLAVGGTNYVEITDTALITATFPAKMYVKSVKVFPISGQTQIINSNDSVIKGTYGIYTETHPCAEKLKLGTDGQIYIWNNMTFDNTVTPFEGTQDLAYNVAAGSWYGLGIQCSDKNMSRYSDGNLNFELRTTSTDPISVGINSTNGGSSYVILPDTGNQYGLVRDGNWHAVQIPLNLFAVDFYTINQPFMITGAAPATQIAMDIDNIYWTESIPRPTPQNGNFGVFTDNTPCVSKFVQPTNGNFYIWSNTLNSTTTTPFEGSNVLSFTSASGQTWFGAAFTPTVKYNLTAYSYANSVLHFDLKTTATTTFQIGMKSGNETDLGQTWITFQNGNDPYGFVRDGNWHGIDIPMSTFNNVDLLHVSQLFELLGTTGAISNIAIDNIYFGGGGNAYTDSTSTVVNVTSISISPVNLSLAVGSNSQLTYSITPTNATNTNVTWESSNSGVATVSSTGLVTAIAAGTATISVITQNGNFTSNSTIVVNVPVTSLAVNPSIISMAPGATNQLSVSILPSNATNQNVTWTSSNSSIASVSSSGLVTAVASGSATISATTQDGNFTATSAITVSSLTNLALNKPATSSSDQAGYTASGANDGNTGTRWSSLFADPQWLEIDLQATYNINQVVIMWETASAEAFQIEVSTDNSTWTSIYSTTTGPGGTQTLNVSGTGRYIRMYGTVRNTVYGYSIWEFEVFGTASNTAVSGISVSPTTVSLLPGGTEQLTPTIVPSNATNQNVTWTSSNSSIASVSSSGLVTAVASGSATITATTQDGNFTATSAITVSSLTNLALNKPATSSSDQTGYTASGANDGNTGTRWSSLFADPQWLEIDLQATYNINQVVIMWETASAEAFQIEVSTDNSTWTSIYSTTTGPGGTQTLNVSGTGRYIRMYGTVRNTVYGYSIWEFEVFGTASNTAVSGISVSPTTVSLLPGGTEQLTPTIVPSNATNQNVTWTSSNSSIASVSSSGLVTAVASGSATITATTQDGNFTATSAITVSSLTNLALNKPATSSSDQTGYTASGANDGNTGTRWSSLFADPQWLEIDLQATYNINQVVIMWETASAEAFQIEVSTDNSTWTSIYSTTTGPGGTQTLNVSGTGRYIRMYGTVRNTIYGYSIWEFEVFGALSEGVSEMTDNSTIDTVSNNSNEYTKVSLYPNPIINQVTINIGDKNNYHSAKIFDMGGRLIYQWIIPEGSFSISKDLGFLSNGIYLIQLEGITNPQTIPFIKQ